jgi:hypothetical protein
MVRRPTLEIGLFLCIHVLLIAATGFLLSRFPVRIEAIFWLIFASITWSGLVLVYLLATGIDRIVEQLTNRRA